ncbi:DNA topoisomerase I [Candidatus Pacearchaeota archaeon]|nr:DNA topoisomerase I [Candidatus Pacearchaeota archaeon]
MPKTPKKTKEEKLAENYFPLDTGDIKKTVEKKVKEKDSSAKVKVEKKYKQIDISTLETVEKKSIKSKTAAKRKKPASKTKPYSHPKTKLKKGGYELVITEKPQAALKIAASLGKAIKRGGKGVAYYEINKNGKEIVVACAVGHLFTLKQEKARQPLPVFNIGWIPNYLVRKNDFTKRYYDTLLKLAKNAGSLTVATDYDVEGEVIGWNIVRFIGNQKDANRMKFSTLTKEELNKAYENKSKNIDWGQAVAGETRHYLDWFYGINLSRALMNAIKTTGSFRVMSIGRVQGPALNMIVQKEKEIQAFKPETYWQVFIKVNDKKNILELKHNKDLFNKKDLNKFKDLKGKTIQVNTNKTEQSLPPNPPFNLTTLQTEIYKFHGITPSNTLRSAQSLYLGGLISYPRTSSQKLPDSIDYKEILKKLSKEYKVENLIVKDKPIEGKKSDPAHPSIYPTGNSQTLSGDEEKVYNLIVKRFLSLFCDNAIVDNKTVKANVDNLIFSTRGSAVRKKAWMSIYPSKLKEIEVPDMNGEAKITSTKTEEKETQPPKRYSPASIISQLEKKNLGTKATRSSILETLYDRGYVQDKSIKATPLGMSLIATLEKYSPIIIDEKLTRNFEDSMQSIQKSTKGFEEKEKKIISKAKNTIIEIAKDFEKKEKDIGKELLQANIKQREQEKEENKLHPCPICKKGDLAITYSRKTRRHFVACNAYPDCKTTFSLPPDSLIKKTDKLCEKCGFPMLMSIKKGKKPWFFCFNPECETNKERIEAYKNKQDQVE